MTCSFVNVSYIAFLTSTDMNVVKRSVTSKVKDIKCIALIEHGSCFFFIRHRYNRGCGFDCIYIRNKESFFDYCEVIISELLLHNRRGLSTHDKMYITKLYHLTAAVFNLQKQIYFKVYYQEKNSIKSFFHYI